MHTLRMHRFSLTESYGIADTLDDDVSVTVAETEGARIREVRELLGGTEDAMAYSEAHETLMFRRLDATAPGGVGYMVAAQLFDSSNVKLVPKRPTANPRKPT